MVKTYFGTDGIIGKVKSFSTSPVFSEIEIGKCDTICWKTNYCIRK